MKEKEEVEESDRMRGEGRGTKLKVNGGRGWQGRVSASCCNDGLIAVFLSSKLFHLEGRFFEISRIPRLKFLHI